MNDMGFNSTNLLDRKRLDDGSENLKDFFCDLLENDKEKAVNLINDENLQFASLFILQPEIEKYGVLAHLIPRHRKALEVTGEVLTRQNSNIECLSLQCREDTHSVLKWVIETGYFDDGLNDQYDEILEKTAILLIKIFKDETILHIMVKMIFNRHKKGYFIYDLVWAFFEFRDVNSLRMIAHRLCSPNSKDVKLAKKLLNFIPGMDVKKRVDNEKLYFYTLDWINVNYSFMYYTGESFQQTSNPKHYCLSVEAKYLCKEISNDNIKLLRSLTIEESKLLDNFKILDDETKILLSNYSFLLYRQNMNMWNIWINYPVKEQIRIAGTRKGGLL